MSILAFEKFCVRWMGEMKRRFERLRAALHQAGIAEEQEVAVLVQACHAHYCEYLREKMKLCKDDASFVVAGMWRTPLEAGFLWMGGWRPTTAVVLAYSLMGMQIESELQKLLEGIELPTMAALSANQLFMLDSLQQKLRQAEDALSNRLAVLQMLLADPQMAKATAANPPPSESNDFTDILEAMEPKLAGLRNLIAEAEQLRGETILQMLQILRPIQAGQYALAAYEMTMAVRKLGKQREAKGQLPPVSTSSTHTNIRELASQGNVDLLAKALETGIDPSEPDFDGRTPLHLAACEGNDDCVSLLINKGADVNKKDTYGVTPLFEALRAGQDSAAKLLIESGAKTHLEEAGIELCRAAASGNISYLSRLMKYGVNPNACDSGDRTALHFAVAEGNAEAAEVLVKEGADVLAMDRRGLTPLDEARVCDDPVVIRFLENELSKRQGAESPRLADASRQQQGKTDDA